MELSLWFSFFDWCGGGRVDCMKFMQNLYLMTTNEPVELACDILNGNRS